MKGTRIFATVLAASIIMTTAVAGASAAGADHSAYGFQAGKEGRTVQAAPYAGMNYEGGEQGDTSAYGYLAGKEGRIDDGRSYAGKDYAGGEQGDTSTYGFRAGRMDKPWNTVE